MASVQRASISPPASARGTGAGRDWSRAAPVVITSVLAAVYLLIDPRSADFAAHLFRAELFAREGFTAWNGQWYGGHHTPAYSVLFPPLASALGPGPAGALAAVAAASAFEPIVHHRYGSRGRWAALWFAVVIGLMLFTGRMPFLLGVALALAALLALQRGKRATSIALAIASALASPVAGLFLALAGIAYELSGLSPEAKRGDTQRGAGAVVAVGAFAPPVLLSIFFPEGGSQPFGLRSFSAVPLAAAALLLLLPRHERTLRVGVALYGLATLAALVVETPMGNNAVRLGELFAGPLALLALAERPALRRSKPALLAVVLATAWALHPPVRDYLKVEGDPSARAEYYKPLLDFLRSQGGGPWRVEALFTRNPFEAAEIAPEFALARGWQRQLDVERNPLFYDRGLFTPLTYGLWLSEHGVRYVAVPDVEADVSSKLEHALIESGRAPYLELRFASEHWQVYEVGLPSRLAVAEDGSGASVAGLHPDSFTLRFERPGSALVRVGWTPYWHAPGACVEKAGRWTRVTTKERHLVRVTIRVSLDRLVSRGRRCS
jgi:hypothetical protein